MSLFLKRSKFKFELSENPRKSLHQPKIENKQRNPNVLLLGEQNFTFAKSFTKNYPDTNVTATCFQENIAISVEQRDGKLRESHEYPIPSHNIKGWDGKGLRFLTMYIPCTYFYSKFVHFVIRRAKNYFTLVCPVCFRAFA